MNIGYLHGLESTLSPQKRTILAKYGNIYSPEIDYYNNPNAIEMLIKELQGQEINVVLGSSIGGFAGYYVSAMLSKPALLFNPALARRSVPQEVPTGDFGTWKSLQIALGMDDQVVPVSETLRFISDSIPYKTEIQLNLYPGTGHRIKEEIFEKEVESFFGKLGY